MNTFNDTREITQAYYEVQTQKGYPVVDQFGKVAPVAGGNTAVHAAVTLSDETQSISTGITNPDIPRNVVVKGNAAGITGDVVVHGKNIRGEAISETIALSGASAVAGNKAFKTVDSFDLPVETHVGTDTVSIGVGVKFGLNRLLTFAAPVFATVTGAPDSALPTFTIDASAIELNTATLATAPNGTRTFAVGYFTTELFAGDQKA